MVAVVYSWQRCIAAIIAIKSAVAFCVGRMYCYSTAMATYNGCANGALACTIGLMRRSMPLFRTVMGNQLIGFTSAGISNASIVRFMRVTTAQGTRCKPLHTANNSAQANIVSTFEPRKAKACGATISFKKYFSPFLLLSCIALDLLVLSMRALPERRGRGGTDLCMC